MVPHHSGVSIFLPSNPTSDPVLSSLAALFQWGDARVSWIWRQLLSPAHQAKDFSLSEPWVLPLQHRRKD